MQSIDVAGTRVRYEDAGTGPPLVLAHGLGQSSTGWRRATETLARTRRVIALDFPGFGASDIPSGASYDPEYFADVFAGFVAALQLERVDAAGHSAGGLVILLDALAHPERYGHVVLVDPAGFTPAPDNLLGTAAVSLVRLLVSIPRNRAMTRALYSTAFYNPRMLDEETVDEIARRRANPAAKAASRRAFTKFFDYCRRLEPLHERLQSLAVPVLVIWGSDDRLFRASDASVAERVLRHARIERIERCGHCPHIECPAQFAAMVLEFLSTT